MSAIEDQQTGERTSAAASHDAYAALRHRDFRRFLAANALATLGEQMLAVAIGWQIYVRTHSALALGLVGLVQVLPFIVLALPAGQIADRRNRVRIVLVTQAALGAGALALSALSATTGPMVLIYVCLLLLGAALAFNNPANSSLVPQVVPAEAFGNAATWSSSAWQLAAVLGPAVSGGLIALTGSATAVYLLNAAGCAAVVVLIAGIRSPQPARPAEPATLRSLGAGIAFLRHTPVILAAITLDLFAVLFGGAVTLLPIFALDILHVGATGLGLLRTAPSVGAVLMALTMAHRPPFARAGRALLLAVAGFGLATIVFGVSRSFALSLGMLALLGAMDNVSVVVRSTLLLTRAPDEVRGRVYAVNGIFVGASNELGGFESGLAAALFGPVAAVVLGGIGTLLVVAAVAYIWPEMRRLGRLMPGESH
ncbi:MAG TPA: MFS transporter [Ktedonobacterales bacterium]|nr:MFS transporter [Ktedonobacterales bacterium]